VSTHVDAPAEAVYDLVAALKAAAKARS